MKSFRQPGEGASLHKTETDKGVEQWWKHATKEEWDASHDSGREILALKDGIKFVVRKY